MLGLVFKQLALVVMTSSDTRVGQSYSGLRAKWGNQMLGSLKCKMKE